MLGQTGSRSMLHRKAIYCKFSCSIIANCNVQLKISSLSKMLSIIDTTMNVCYNSRMHPIDIYGTVQSVLIYMYSPSYALINVMFSPYNVCFMYSLLSQRPTICSYATDRNTTAEQPCTAVPLLNWIKLPTSLMTSTGECYHRWTNRNFLQTS